MINPLQTNVNITNRADIENKYKAYENIQDKEKLKRVCQDFESVFIQMMLKEMRNTLSGDSLTEDSQAKKLMQSLHDEELSKEMSKGKGMGLAQELYKQLARGIR